MMRMDLHENDQRKREKVLHSTFYVGLVTIFLLFLLCCSCAYATDRTDWLWPVPNSRCITNGRGYRNSSPKHLGIDIPGEGLEIKAAKAGEVVWVYYGCKNYNGYSEGHSNCIQAGCQPNGAYYYPYPKYSDYGYCNDGYGNGVIIKHNDDTYSHYGHMSGTPLVSVGNWVEQGTTLGYTGASGMADGAHLHFAVSPTPNCDTSINSNPSYDDWITMNNNHFYDSDGISFVTEGGYLDINGRLNGTEVLDLGVFGLCDVYIENTLVKADTNDFYTRYKKGTSYRINHIRAKEGYQYIGDEEISGIIGNTDVSIWLDFTEMSTLVIKGELDGEIKPSIEGYGTYTVFIDHNETPDKPQTTSYQGTWKNGTFYSIEQITAAEGKHFDGIRKGKQSGNLDQPGTNEIILAFSTNGDYSTEWKSGKTVPGNLEPELLDIEYRNRYETTGAVSPGEGWERSDFIRSDWVNDGAPVESCHRLPTSETFVETGYKYYHYCSGSTGNYVSFHATPQFVHADEIPDSNSVEIVKELTDDDDPTIPVFVLKWKDGGTAYCNSNRTCDPNVTGPHGNRSQYWYRMTTYQNRHREDIYKWIRVTEWGVQQDSGANSNEVRWRLKGGIALDPDNITGIAVPDSITLVTGETVHLDVDVIPHGIDKSVLTYTLSDTRLFEIDDEQNITCKYAGENTEANLVISAPNGVSRSVRLIARVSKESEWQETLDIPENIDRTLLRIEYKHRYETVAESSPGEGWEQVRVHQTYYADNGSIEEYPYEQTPSETYVPVGWYYYHWCGNYCGNYVRTPGKYETFHRLNNPEAYEILDVASDTNVSYILFYTLRNGTCETGQTNEWYRMYQYQPRRLVTEYVWSTETEWTETPDPAAGSYRVRWKLAPPEGQKAMYLPAEVKDIEAEAFAGSNARFFFLPAGVSRIGDYAFPENSFVFLNTAALSGMDFRADGVWFIETGKRNEAFAALHPNYLLRSGSAE